MSVNLSSYSAIEAALFFKIDVPDYTPGPLLFSSYNIPVEIEGDTYIGLGNFLSVTDTSSDIRATAGTLSVTLSGIPNSSIQEILSLRLKGSNCYVWRVLFDAITKQILAIPGNPVGRFQGRVENYSVEEDYDNVNSQASNTLAMSLSSVVETLESKIAGRATNPTDQKYFFPDDLSMDKVLALANSNLNFGAPL